MSKSMCDELFEVRSELGKTQKEFAYILGVGASTYSAWESGKPVGDLYLEKVIKKLKELKEKKESNPNPGEKTGKAEAFINFIRDSKHSGSVLKTINRIAVIDGEISSLQEERKNLLVALSEVLK